MATSWITLMAVGIPMLLGTVYIWRRVKGRSIIVSAVLILAVVATLVAWGVPKRIEAAEQAQQNKVNVLAQAFRTRYDSEVVIQSLQEVERVYIFVRNDGDIQKVSLLVGTTWVELGSIE